MAKNIDRIALGIGAKVIGKIPEIGGGAFGAARLAEVIEKLRIPACTCPRIADGQADRYPLGAPPQSTDE